uniref:Uncharacterized protein n=1 Tax=Sander lucioperca TaxID=283035 RepID=A0A8C9XXK9_SANLU
IHATLNLQQTVQKPKLGNKHQATVVQRKHVREVLTDRNINNRPDSEVTPHLLCLFSFSSCLIWQMWKDLSKRFHRKTTITSLFHVHAHLRM